MEPTTEGRHEVVEHAIAARRDPSGRHFEHAVAADSPELPSRRATASATTA
ncbi:MAG: hypothetical protein IPP16_02020 [Acidimicrobiaceae bacterium]|nr:hypothetical protein [Acidimicrobiaceae bacterium]